jgi:hypothetical protein
MKKLTTSHRAVLLVAASYRSRRAGSSIASWRAADEPLNWLTYSGATPVSATAS